MKFHILTLFPEMVMGGLLTSIIGRAEEKKILELNAVNIRDFTMDKHGKVDDYPYGGGAGMLMQAQPVYDAHQAVSQGRKVRTIYVTPQGRTFTQRLARELSREEELIFLCGHYEGIDERVLEEVVTDYISIGDYVLTGGELPAMVMIDAISRLLPGVLNNDCSAETESFHNDLLEYPQYSRPEIWRDKEVPGVLLSGNHSSIRRWRLEQAVERTESRRPDLYAKYMEKEKLIRQLMKTKRDYIHMIEALRRGMARILCAKGNNILLYLDDCNICMLSAESVEKGEALLPLVPKDTELIVSSQEFMNERICSFFSFQVYHECYQVCYTRKEPLPVRHKDIRILQREHLAYVTANYSMGEEDYIARRIQDKSLYGAFVEDKIVGFVGSHDEGSMGILFVEEAYRRQGIGEALEAYCINRWREQGATPYAHIIVGNDTSMRLQDRLGLYTAPNTIWWLGSAD